VPQETELAMGPPADQLSAGRGGRRHQVPARSRFPELGPQITTVMTTQSEAGVANLARLVERQIPA